MSYFLEKVQVFNDTPQKFRFQFEYKNEDITGSRLECEACELLGTCITFPLQ